MSDSLEKLAQSRTFVCKEGEMSPTGNGGRVDFIEDMLRPGAVVDGKYRLMGEIAHGGFGAVHRVHHLMLDKNMALKTFLVPNVSTVSWLRFQREAQAIAKLKHANIVDVFDFGVAEGRLPYYTMELLEGKSLAHEIYQKGPIGPRQALAFFRQIADALAHAHRQNIIHRDIKPANIMLIDVPGRGDKRQAKLVDFGVSKLATHQGESDDQEHTRAGTVFGSPLYMSPEQSLGLPTDQRTDIYSYGCTLYETLTGRPPFIGSTAMITMVYHQRQPPPSLASSGARAVFPSKLETFLKRLLAKNIAERYQNFEEVICALDECASILPPDPVPELPPGAPQEVQSESDGKGTDELGGRGERYGRGESSRPEPRKLAAGGYYRANEITVENRGPSKKVIIAAVVSLGTMLIAVTAVLLIKVIRDAKPIPPALTHAVQADTDTLVHSLVNPKNLVKASPATQMYFVGTKKEADGLKRIFYFPPDEQAGTFSFMAKSVKCSGEVVVPADANLIFNAGEGPYAKPDLFLRFGPNDLYGIVLAPQLYSSQDHDWSQPHLEKISTLTGLRMLNWARAQEMTPNGVKSIDVLRNLQILNCGYSGMTSEILNSLTILPQLTNLDMSAAKDPGKTVQYLVDKDSKVETLIMNYCWFKPGEVRRFTGLKRVKLLSLTGCLINDKTISDLELPPQLSSLNLAENALTDRSLPALARFKHLKDLSLPGGPNQISPAGYARLKQVLPGCAILNQDSLK